MAEKDLIPLNKRTKEEQKEITTNAGIASGVSRRKKKIFKEAIANILELPATPKMLEGIQKAFDIGKNVKLTLKEAMVYAQTIKAIANKDTQAFNALVDRVDGKAIQQVETANISDIRNTIVVTQEQLDEEEKEMREALKE